MAVIVPAELSVTPTSSGPVEATVPPELVAAPADAGLHALVSLRGTGPARTSVRTRVPGHQVPRFRTEAA